MDDLYTTFARAFATTTLPLAFLLLIDKSAPAACGGVLIVTTIISAIYTMGWAVAQR
jgi:hypothetical protein